MMLQNGVFLLLLSTIISLVIGKFFIPMLRKKSIGQNIRDDGPQSHLAKQGTPTMGGIIFILTILILVGVFRMWNAAIGITLLSMLGFGAIGFIDDFFKLMLKRSLGLTAKQKIVLQIILSIGMIFLHQKYLPTPYSRFLIPFTSQSVDLGLVAIPLLIFIMIGTVNAVNLTDGLDGLATSVSIPAFAVLALIALTKDSLLTQFIIVVIGSLLGFLAYNTNKASIFMGDTGSMAIGGLFAGLALTMNMSLYLPLFGFIFMIEALSVIIQVISYKTRNKKRVFLMSPIHHHYELKGYNEQKIVTNFTLVSIITGLLTIIAYLQGGL